MDVYANFLDSYVHMEIKTETLNNYLNSLGIYFIF